MRIGSVAAFALMVVGLIWMFESSGLFGGHVLSIVVQGLAVLVMLWARLTFGRRSFHAAANTTSGDLVTSGPYAYVRHPIYASVLYFAWAGALDHRTPASLGGAVLITVGAVIRMLTEERFLVVAYPAYRNYMRRTARIVPGVL